jgi:hypothetical protein
VFIFGNLNAGFPPKASRVIVEKYLWLCS